MGVMFSYLWVSRCNYLLFPDPVELTFSNTILLSIAASCLCVYSLNGNLFLINIYFYLGYFAGLLFFYISDSFYASSFYLITGLHFSHVIVGIILLGFTFTSLYNVKLFYTNIQLL